jgi:hypothetical protein
MKSDSHRDESKLTHPVSEHPDRYARCVASDDPRLNKK